MGLFSYLPRYLAFRRPNDAHGGDQTAPLAGHPQANETSHNFNGACGLGAALGFLKSSFCIALHVLLLASHLILVVLGFNGHPLHLVKDYWYTKGFFTSLNFGPNFIGKAYLVVLLWYTQKLALRRNLHKKQPPTAIHDQATAWLGLGSAIPVLLDQYSTCVSPSYVICIFLYLVGLFVLGVTMPMLLSVGAVYDHEARYLNITTYLDKVGTNPKMLINAFPVVNLLPLAGWDISTDGWKDNIVYDIPNFVAPRPVRVSATRVQVRCWAIANASQSGVFDAASGTYPFVIDPRIEDINIAPINRALYVLPLAMKSIVNSTSAPEAPSTMIIASTLSIQDDVQSRWASVTSFKPPVNPDTCQFKTDCETFSSLQLLACDTDFRGDCVNAIPQLGLPSNATGTAIKSGWNNWTLPAPSRNSALSLINQFGTLSPRSNTAQKYHTTGPDFNGSYTFSMLETNIMDALRFDHEDNSQINLGELEMVLQNAVAAVFWRASVRMALEIQFPFDELVQASQTYEAPFRYSVQISFWPPIVGCAVSALLLVLAVVLTRHAKPASAEHNELDTTGVLQLTWLLSEAKVHEPEKEVHRNIADTLKSEVPVPFRKELRKKGKDIIVAGWDSGETSESKATSSRVHQRQPRVRTVPPE